MGASASVMHVCNDPAESEVCTAPACTFSGVTAAERFASCALEWFSRCTARIGFSQRPVVWPAASLLSALLEELCVQRWSMVDARLEITPTYGVLLSQEVPPTA
jgi:hypothetical protein